MASELEFVPFKDFVESLPVSDNPTSAEKSVLSGSANGIKAFYAELYSRKAVQNVSGANVVDLKSLSLGQINITGSGWTWWQEVIASTNAVARINQDVVLDLKKDDVITLSDFTNYKLNVGYTLDGGATYSYSGWKNVPFVCPGDGRYVFCVSSNDGTTTHTIEEFASVVRVVSANSAVSLVNTENRLNKDNSLIGRNFFKKISVTGTGSAVYAYFDAIPGTKMRFHIDNPNWAVTSIASSSTSKLLIVNIKSDGTTTQIKKYTRDQQIPSFFDVDIPANEYRARIHFVADVGENVNFVLEYRPMQFEDVDKDLQQLQSRKVDIRKMSLGRLNIAGTGWTWWDETAATSGTEARINKDVSLVLKTGDEISLTDFVNYKLNVGYTLDSGSTYSYTGNKNVKFVCPGNGQYVFQITSNDGTTTHTLEEFKAVLSIKSSEVNAISSFYMDSTVDDAVVRVGKLNYASFTMEGNGVNWVYARIPAMAGKMLRLRHTTEPWAHTSLTGAVKKMQLATYTSAGVGRDLIGFYISQSVPTTLDIEVPSDAVYIKIGFRADVGVSVAFEVEAIEMPVLKSRVLRSTNHRGYNFVAPENTLPAYILSAKMGFDCVETDIQKTSDGYYVCIHDETVDRTSDGTGRVSEMTLEQLKALDFGSWRSSYYAGTKIPTLEEFLECCHDNGLHPYIELKAGFDELDKVAAAVKAYGMEKDVTFISYLLSALAQMKTLSPYARLGWVLTSFDADTVTSIQGLKNGANEAFANIQDSLYSSEIVDACIEGEIGLEIWTCDVESEMRSYSRYVSGIASNQLVAAVVLGSN